MDNQNEQRGDILQYDSKNKFVPNPPVSMNTHQFTIEGISHLLANSSVEKLQDFEDDSTISEILTLATQNASQAFPLEVCVLPSSFHKYIGKKREVLRKESNCLLIVKLPSEFIIRLSRLYPGSIWFQLAEPTLGTPLPPQARLVLKLSLNITSSLGKELPPIKELVGFAQNKKTGELSQLATDIVQVDTNTNTVTFHLRFLKDPFDFQADQNDVKKEPEVWYLTASCECPSAVSHTFSANNFSRPYELIFHTATNTNPSNQIAISNQPDSTLYPVSEGTCSTAIVESRVPQVTEISPIAEGNLDDIDKGNVVLTIYGKNMPVPAKIYFDRTVATEIHGIDEDQKSKKQCIVPSLLSVIEDRLESVGGDVSGDERLKRYYKMKDYFAAVTVRDMNNKIITGGQPFIYESDARFVPGVYKYLNEGLVQPRGEFS